MLFIRKILLKNQPKSDIIKSEVVFMNLINTKKYMENLKENGFVEWYSVLVCRNNKKDIIFSDNTTKDTYFDIASMGKILVTATLILKAVDEKKLSLDDKLEKFFINSPKDKKEITIKQLLTHTSGIVRCVIPKYIADKGNESIAEHIINNPLAYKPGEGKIYSCNAYILLGFIVEKIYNMPLDEAFYKYTKKALNLTKSCFNINVDEPNAAVSYRRKNVGIYRVDDDNVYNMAGIAGSGGQFWTMADLEKFCDAVMKKSEKLYSGEIYDLAEKSLTGSLGDDANGFGWLITDERYRQTGELFPSGSFGHCGHTGTSFFFNRNENMYACILTNATRCLWMKNNCDGYDYNIICRMRENIHNKILQDISVT